MDAEHLYRYGSTVSIKVTIVHRTFEEARVAMEKLVHQDTKWECIYKTEIERKVH